MKKVLALLLVTIALLGLCACGNDADGDKQPTATNPPPSTTVTYGPPPPEDVGAVAEAFISAYCQHDRLTYFPMYCYDHRGAELAKIIANGQTEAEFCAEAKRQLEAKEELDLDMPINSFDDFLAAKYEADKIYKKDAYGAYTVTVKALGSEPLDATTLNDTRSALMARWDEKCFDVDAMNAITDGHIVTVEIFIDGEKKDWLEHYRVLIVPYKGEWRVLSHSI